MPRPRLPRRVGRMPGCNRFYSEGQASKIEMTVDEYETIRLIDYLGLSQEECADKMNVSRSTVQGIYVRARKILAEFLIEGKHLNITGGDVELYDDGGCCRRQRGCFKK